MSEPRLRRSALLAFVDAASARSIIRRELDAFAWDLVSRLTDAGPDGTDEEGEIPLDSTPAKG